MGEEYDAVNQIVLGVISWTTLFLFIRKILSKRSFGFCNRLVSTIHAILAVILASLSVEDWSCPVCPLASAPSLKQACAKQSSFFMCGSEQVAALLITEISSPFLHARELLKEVGYRDTDLNLAADMTFGVIFSVARMVGGPYLTFLTLSAAYNPMLIKAMAVGLQLVSAFWFYKIVKMVKYKLGKARKVGLASPSLQTAKLD
ncbi:hypothetical protein V6N13_011749 [Hibiscus sabdariffa]|uniref:Uncharacterized protein n=2 Tax=Hibiscus sabdariffa TaxID=183260 RepID=A0ABR2SDR0_9ROSI